MEDLLSLLKKNKQHYKGLRSKALLLAKKGDLDGAIFTLNYAISLQPSDIELYTFRAELYEKVNE